VTEEAPGDDALLVRRCAEGDDPDAWTAFVDRHGGLIAGLARRMLLGRSGRATAEDVDDVVAEVFLALLRRDRLLLRRYDPRYRLSTYLGVICRTAVVRHLRRRRVVSTHEVQAAVEPAAVDEPPHEGPDRLLTRERLEDALAELPPRDRLLLTLRFLDGLDYRAIAEAVGVDVESVGSLLTRARRRLAERAEALRDLLADDRPV
jgi:RNA polymerase sigma-70 factor (ECF subfamily)